MARERDWGWARERAKARDLARGMDLEKETGLARERVTGSDWGKATDWDLEQDWERVPGRERVLVRDLGLAQGWEMDLVRETETDLVGVLVAGPAEEQDLDRRYYRVMKIPRHIGSNLFQPEADRSIPL